jgi:CRP/FNR family transcriptional regulator
VGANTELMAVGERAERFANILSGVVKLSKLLPDGRQQIVELQFAPDLLGRLFSESSEVSAEAAGTVRLCSFPRAALEELLRQSPDLMHRLHEQALRELDEARDWIMTVGRKTAAEKVASFLLLVARNLDPEDHDRAVQFDIPLGRGDVADFLGLTIETVSRQLTRLRKEGIISFEGTRRVTIVDYPALKEAAGA